MDVQMDAVHHFPLINPRITSFDECLSHDHPAGCPDPTPAWHSGLCPRTYWNGLEIAASCWSLHLAVKCLGGAHGLTVFLLPLLDDHRATKHSHHLEIKRIGLVLRNASGSIIPGIIGQCVIYWSKNFLFNHFIIFCSLIKSYGFVFYISQERSANISTSF